MTAEVVVMNTVAVALAADSAVTLSPSQKVFTSAEKLFSLVPGHTVGFMIYNVSGFMLTPWETIVKAYRDFFPPQAGQLDTIQDYAQNFLLFLSTQGNTLFPDEQQRIAFQQNVSGIFLFIRDVIVEKVQEKIYSSSRKISYAEIAQIVSQTIDSTHAVWQTTKNKYPDDENAELLKCLAEKYREFVGEGRDTIFEQLPLTDEDKRKLEELAYYLFSKDRIVPNNTGLVFAGFGKNDLFPGCVEYIVENFVCNRLKVTKGRELLIGPGKDKAMGTIMPFAQEDVVRNFIGGIHPRFRTLLIDQLSDVLSDESIKQVAGTLKGVRKERRAQLEAALRDLKKDKLDKVLENMKKGFSQNVDSILETVTSLPIDELAVAATTLVNLTSFMRHVSADVESVGGPIDVAVISKKDGFIWIKRKHYFDIQYNPLFDARFEVRKEERNATH